MPTKQSGQLSRLVSWKGSKTGKTVEAKRSRRSSRMLIQTGSSGYAALPDGFTCCMEHAWEGKKQCKRMAQMLQSWGQIEETSARGYRNAWTGRRRSSVGAALAVGSFRCESSAAWEKTLGEAFQTCAEKREVLGQWLQEAGKNLRIFQKEQTRLIRRLQDEGVALDKELLAKQAEHERSRAKYQKACLDTENFIRRRDTECRSSTMLDLERAWRRVDMSMQLIDETELECKKAANLLRTCQVHHGLMMGRVLQDLQALEETRVDRVAEVLRNVSFELEKVQSAEDSKIMKQLRQTSEKVQGARDTDQLVAHYMKESPVEVEFQSCVTPLIEQERANFQKSCMVAATTTSNAVVPLSLPPSMKLPASAKAPLTASTISFSGGNKLRRANSNTKVAPSLPTTTSNQTHTKNQKPPLPQKRPQMPPRRPVIHKVEALYDFEPLDSTELSLMKGDRIDVFVKHENGWWEGMCCGKRGLFPSNYVQDCEAPEDFVGTPENENENPVSTHEDPVPSPEKETHKSNRDQLQNPDLDLEKYIAKYDFVSRDVTELSIHKGQRLYEAPAAAKKTAPSSAGWVFLANSDGDKGLVPCNYIKSSIL